jgi:hypothetical protein
MQRKFALTLISKLLEIAEDEFSNHICNDLPDDFYEGFDEKDIQDLYKEWHRWNGDPEEYSPNFLGYLGEDALMGFFSDYIKNLEWRK